MTRFIASLWLLLLSASALKAQTVFRLDSLPQQGVLLDKGWKWHAGDNPDWAKPEFDDRSWKPVDPTQEIKDIPQLWKTDISWFRLRFVADCTLVNQTIAMLVQQTGASEIFLNGQFIGQFGTINRNTHQVRAVTPPDGTFIGVPVRKPGEQVLAVRFAVQKNLPYIIVTDRRNPTVSLRLMETKFIDSQSNISVYFEFLRSGGFLIFAMLHLALFWFTPAQKSNLYFFLYAFLNAIGSALWGLCYNLIHLASTKVAFQIIGILLAFPIGFILLLTAVYTVFNHRRGVIYWTLVGYALVGIVLLLTNYHNGFYYGLNILLILIPLECVRIIILAAKRGQRGANIMVWGAIGYLICATLFYLFAFNYLPAGPKLLYLHLAYNIAHLSIPIAISTYLALESSYASRSLRESINEIQHLSAEKQQLLTTQNEMLERQVSERTNQLQQSLTDLRATQTQLIQKEKMASLGELTAGIAHEIQNPLNFVNNFSEVSTELTTELKEELTKGDVVEAQTIADDLSQNLQKITHHGRRASAIVKGMLEHSRTSTGERQPTDLNALADEYLRLAYQGLRAKDNAFTTELKTEFDPHLSLVNVAPQEIGRVLLNLYNNAFYAVGQRASGEGLAYGPTVWVSTHRLADAVEIRVKDNGTGISDAVKAKIFQPFFTTKPTGEGTGLGLSLSYDIVTKGHGGTLEVQSAEGQGTTFVVKLPIS